MIKESTEVFELHYFLPLSMSICVFKFRRYNVHSVNVQTHWNTYAESALFNDATYTDAAPLEATTAVSVIAFCRDMNTGETLDSLTHMYKRPKTCGQDLNCTKQYARLWHVGVTVLISWNKLWQVGLYHQQCGPSDTTHACSSIFFYH